MGEIRKKLTIEDYEKLMVMDYAERSATIKASLPESLLMGYGYYGHRLFKEDGECFVGIDIGNGCD